MIPLRDTIAGRTTPFVSYSFIGANLLVYLWQMSLGQQGFQKLVYSLGVIPAALLGDASLPPELYIVPPTATVFTSMFLHGGLLHLAGNMLYLWIFSDNVEDAMGHVRFVIFYFLSGIGAALAQAVLNADSTVPMIGASGAISGVLGAYLLLFPRAQVLVLIPLGLFTQLVHLPAMFVLGLWFVLQLVSSAFTGGDGGGVAFGAHIGGFVVGMVLIPLFKHRDQPLFGRGNPRRR